MVFNSPKILSVFRGIALAVVSLTAQLAFAAEEAESEPASLSAVQFTDPAYLVQVFFSLLLVLGAILLLSYLAKKFELNSIRREGPIKILHSIGIGGKDQLLLIAVGGEQVLISKTPGSVQAIHHLKQPIKATTANEPEPIVANVFAKVLKREM